MKGFALTRDGFKAAKDCPKLHWKGNNRLDGRNLAAYYLFNSNTSYGPHFLGWPSSVYLQEERDKKMIEKVRDFSAPNLDVGGESFDTVIPRHKNDFLYCDPPYHLDGDSKTFIGMYPHRNFPIHHKGFKHEVLRDQLRAHKGGIILSYNDCSIREWYKESNMIAPKWQYTFSQGDKHGALGKMPKVLSAIVCASMLGFVGGTSAAEPVTLTDTQIDDVRKKS